MPNIDNKKVKEYIGFHYLLIKTLVYTLILVELNIFYKKYSRKSKINLSFTVYL